MSGLFNRLRRGRRPVQLEEDPYNYQQYQYKVRFSLIGTVRAGKSTLAAALIVVAATMSAKLEGFYCRVLPKSSRIMVDANNLRLGRFPPKTDPFLPVAQEAGLIIGQAARNPFGKDKVTQIPICDVGGEVMDAIASGIFATPTKREYIRNINRQVINHIRDSQGFIIVLPATDALMFRTTYQEMEADSYLYSILSEVMDYKKRGRDAIEGIAIWFTKWDQAMDDAKDMGMDIYAGDAGMERFMVNGFPNLAMLIKGFRDAGKVRYFRSYFDIKKRADGSDDTWPDGSPRITIIEDENDLIRFRPSFDGEEYVKFIRWAGSFAK
jgi:hypothetical protein